MADRNTISVVVPTFNRADLLPFTLEAVFAQTRRPDEIIVVDDGSTDDTSRILQHYGSRLTVVHQVNSGDLAARNAGVRRARSDLVAFCDSDDLWRPDFLACMTRFWLIEPRTTVAYSNFVVVRDNEWTSRNKFQACPSGFFDGMRVLDDDLAVFDNTIIEKIIQFQPFFPSCMVVNRRFFAEIGGWDEAMAPFVGRDFGTVLRLAAHVPIGVAKKPLVGIRKHGGNDSGDVLKMNLGDANVLETAARMRPELAAHSRMIRESIRQRRLAALDIAFARMDFTAVTSTANLLEKAGLDLQTKAKISIAALPSPARRSVAHLLLRIGSMRARRREMKQRSRSRSIMASAKSQD
jgi:glycosyltransferase involved in cell wall biosynthesis